MLALDILNQTRPYKIFVWDTKSDFYQEILGVKALKHRGALVIIALVEDKNVEEVCKRAQSLSVPIVVLTSKPHIPDIGNYVFRDFITPKIQVKNLVNYVFNKLNLSSFVILSPESDYGEAFSEAFKETVFTYGGKIVKEMTYLLNTKDFRPQIRDIAESHFDAIFIPDNPLRAAFIISEFAFYSKRDLVFLGTDLWYTPKFIKLIQGHLKTAYFAVGFTDKAKDPYVVEFVNKFKKIYDEMPHYLAAQAYDIGKILLYLLDQYTLDRDSILMLKNFRGVTGTTSFLPNGDVDKVLHIIQIRNRQFIVAY